MNNVTKLLKSTIPQYTLTLPLSGKRVKYRPFLVKEEKVLLLALEEQDDEMIVDAIKNLIESCCPEIENAGDIPLLDFQYLFLNIRAKSVGETTHPQIVDPNTKEKITLSIDITKIKPKISKEFSNKISLTPDVGVTLTPPTLNMSTSAMGLSQDKEIKVSEILRLLNKCVTEIYTKDEIIQTKDLTGEELTEFFDSLTSEQLSKISDYFEQIPELSYKVKYKTSDGKERSFVIEGLDSFFG